MILSPPTLMGIVNVTPDSFSDGGRFINPDRAAAHAFRLIDEGARIIDIGGESTRPGATPVSAQQEMDRVLPVVEKLQGCGALISVDTRNAATMQAAIIAGAGMINDVSALRHDPDSLDVIMRSNAKLCLMHMQGDPQTMQNNPLYNNVVQDVHDFLIERVTLCEAAGIDRSRLVIDPGIGFGKGLQDNLNIIRSVSKFAATGIPVLMGVSRKSFIERICDDFLPQGRPAGTSGDRLPGSIAAALYAWQQGASIFRVHDVAATRQAFAVYQVMFSSA